ncbi:MAG: lipid-binding SYLF domain-containing protein [Gammaproteobacteria bacterium]|nr:lipid-binding SYLF domain-containing protein [Gammaproteobacteria bacterium]MBT8105253.1 lipid-binding SYLF domain-containing protein [Gammaproteobacteria bacterium]NNK25267.1 lipid-binding SYLF domain-containing protein [Woeseiaceae bacterium]NNL64308.1 lipid-binding SYLF domain-containing protein [Woeseiaceae bacterium]
MNSKRILTIVTLLTLAFTSSAFAATREEKRVADAADVVERLTRIPEKSIPPSLLSHAYAVAVVPDVMRAAFGLGARRGKGIIVIRQDDESWSNPAFITLTGGSVGWQVGAESTDVILVFKTRKGVDGIANGKLTLGANASVAAGPVGRQGSVATDIEFEAEVYSYSRSRGLFAGIALEGAGVTMDRKANARFYGSPDMTPEKIFASSPNIAPNIANTFVQVLTAQTLRLPKSPGMQAGADADASSYEDDEPEVRTFGLPGPGESDDDTGYDPNY